MENNRNLKRLATVIIVALIIALGYVLGSLAFNAFLAMYGL